MRDSNQINTTALEVTQNSTKPAYKCGWKEEWIFPVENTSTDEQFYAGLNSCPATRSKEYEEKQKDAAAYLNSDAFFARWDLFCAKLDALSAKLNGTQFEAQTEKLSVLSELNLAA
ncbi:MAG: hypothetical protein EOO43_14880 [Flavobacterium sp.]|nr:MAG: hypothetical protein EOO43_14880 [Flavobacterium sp.]